MKIIALIYGARSLLSVHGVCICVYVSVYVYLSVSITG